MEFRFHSFNPLGECDMPFFICPLVGLDLGKSSRSKVKVMIRADSGQGHRSRLYSWHVVYINTMCWNKAAGSGLGWVLDPSFSMWQ